MPHSPQAKKRAITRLRRIQGQALALEHAIDIGTDCNALLQQLAALRGATTGLMAEVMEAHMRETFTHSTSDTPAAAPLDLNTEIDQLMRIVRSYLK